MAMASTRFLLLLSISCFLARASFSWKYGDTLLVNEWSTVDFEYPSEAARETALKDGSFQPDKSVLAGIKVYKNRVYVTIPRWRAYTGMPVTLATIEQVQGQTKLRPYPDWPSQKVGDCNNLIYAQSMEIDPNTGLMYVLDTGRLGLSSPDVTPKNLCPAKLVIYDLNTNTKVASHDFPNDMVAETDNYVNDIVLDYIDGELRFAYMSDVMTGQMHIFDFRTNKTRNLVDPESMNPETSTGGTVITVNGVDYNFNAALDGIAMSPNFDHVYYCAVGGYNLWAVPTSTLRNGGSKGIRKVGRKISQSDGMVFSNKRLYYGALGLNAVYSWDPAVDIAKQGSDINTVKLQTESQLVRNDDTMQWPDTFALDEHGWLWFVSNRLHIFQGGVMDFSGSEINMRIWKVFVNESTYLYDAPRRTKQNPIL